MKHPHCNRSHAAHLFWCRGFTPVVFIFAIALFVIAIGSGAYFALYDNAQAPSPQDIAIAPVSGLIEGAIPTEKAVSENVTTPRVAPTTIVNCGTDSKTASKCIAEHIKSCSPARGTVTDLESGLTVERIIDGYQDNKCLYRTNIVSGEGNFALLAGMDVNCLVPKSTIAVALQDELLSKDDMLAYCTGSFIDLMREQMGVSSQ